MAAFEASGIRTAEARARGAGPSDALMQRAAAGLAVACIRVLRERAGGVAGRRVVVLAGSGDNGGDGLLAGVRLCARGVAVTAVLVGTSAYQPGLAALRSAGGLVVDLGAAVAAADSSPAPGGPESEGPDSLWGTGVGAAAVRAVTEADLVMDAVVGLRGAPGLAPWLVELLAQVRGDAAVLAVDLPSGVDPASGEARLPHVRADVTVAFGTYKACHLVPPAAHAMGRLELVDVGITPDLEATGAQPVVQRLGAADVAALWPQPRRTDHKYSRGVLGVVAGSQTYPGAAVMTCTGAIRAGAAIVKYTGPASAAAQIIAARPEVEPRPGRVNAYVIGPGVLDDPSQDAAMEAALDSGLPVVADAGGLHACVVARRDGRRAAAADRVLLTPHAGELSRLLALVGHDVPREEVEASPWRHARTLARAIDATVLIKGPTTLVVPPHGPAFSQAEGTPWMAAGGSGDVLAGMCGALLATGVPAPLAGALAATVHGRAGTGVSAGGPVAPADLADAVPAVLAGLLTAEPSPAPSRRGVGGRAVRRRRR
jgi:hydroxyethylthiazole kinase-like uncharacterized protein yjeF